MSRLVSTLSLDGERISADLIVHFQRALSSATAESVADEIAKAATEILGEEITQGEIGISGDELSRRIRTKISLSAAKVTEVDVKALTLAESEVSANKSMSRTRRASSPPPRAPGHGSSGAIPVTRASSSAPPPSLAAPPSPKVRTLWPRALDDCEPGASVPELGARLGLALRDSVAAAVLHAFVAVDPEATDRMDLFGSSNAVGTILLEVSACFSSAAYRIFVANGVDGAVAYELVTTALTQVLAPDGVSAEDFGRYTGSDAPVRELANRLSSAIGAPQTAGMLQASLGPDCEVLRDDLLRVAARLATLVA